MEILKAGQIFKNLVALFAALEMNPKANGNARIRQIKDIKTLCNYHKEGNKIIIDEVFETKKERYDTVKMNGRNP